MKLILTTIAALAASTAIATADTCVWVPIAGTNALSVSDASCFGTTYRPGDSGGQDAKARI